MGIEDEKKPYQPTKEEMRKAENTMSTRQEISSLDREDVYKDGLWEDIKIDVHISSQNLKRVRDSLNHPEKVSDLELSGALYDLNQCDRDVERELNKLETLRKFIDLKREELLKIAENRKKK